MNAITMTTTKKIAIEFAKKEIRNKWKHFLTNYKVNTKEGGNAGKEGQKKTIRHRENIKMT